MIASEAHLSAMGALMGLADGASLAAPLAEDAARLRVALDADGAVCAFVRAFEPAPGHHWITAPRFRAGGEATAAGLLGEVMALAEARGWRRVSTRVDAEALPPGYEAALLGHGFVAARSRVEFKTPVEALPPEDESPFEWVPLDVFGEAETIALIDRAGEGPEWEPDDTGASVLAHALGRRDVSAARDAVQVGLIDGAPAAFVIAQVDPPSGWSTITFMGLAPEFRGRGLGRHVHRRGMALLRGQGGTLYHGGTSATNRPMMRLFEQHGCRVHARLVEYVAQR